MSISTSIPTNFHIRDADLGSILVSREYLSTTYRSLIDDRTRSDAYWWGANYPVYDNSPDGAINDDTRRLNYLQRESADWNSPSSTGNLFYTKEIVDIQHNQTTKVNPGWKKRTTSFIVSDGTLWMSGFNASGQLGQPYSSSTTYQYFSRGAPFQVGSSNDWIHCAPGTALTLAIKRDGTLWAWGRNEYGVAGTGADTNNNTDITDWSHGFTPPTDITSLVKTSATGPPLNSKWRHVSCGYLFAMFIDQQGYLYGSGKNSFGQLGNFGTTDSGGYMKRVYGSSSVPGYEDKWRYVQAGVNSWIGIKEDGRLYGCGDLFGTRYPIELRERWDDFGRGYIHCDISHSHWAAIRNDGTLWTGGPYHFPSYRNACYGQHENFDFTDPPLVLNNRIGPAPQISDTDGPGRILKVAGGPFRYVTCGFWFTIVIGADGRLYGYGNSNDRQLNPNSTLWIYQPQLLEYNKTVQYSNWRQVKAQDYGCLGLNSTQFM